jgi:hypothetical protein
VRWITHPAAQHLAVRPEPGRSAQGQTRVTQRKVRFVSIVVKAEDPSGRAKISSDDPKHALGVVQYLRTIGYKAWIEDKRQ